MMVPWYLQLVLLNAGVVPNLSNVNMNIIEQGEAKSYGMGNQCHCHHLSARTCVFLLIHRGHMRCVAPPSAVA